MHPLCGDRLAAGDAALLLELADLLLQQELAVTEVLRFSFELSGGLHKEATATRHDLKQTRLVTRSYEPDCGRLGRQIYSVNKRVLPAAAQKLAAPTTSYYWQAAVANLGTNTETATRPSQ